ncbi:hypothetical protein D3C71_2080050 [compost metagenome]
MGQAHAGQFLVAEVGGVADGAQQGALLLLVAAPLVHQVEEELQRDATGFAALEVRAGMAGGNVHGVSWERCFGASLLPIRINSTL